MLDNPLAVNMDTSLSNPEQHHLTCLSPTKRVSYLVVNLNIHVSYLEMEKLKISVFKSKTEE